MNTSALLARTAQAAIGLLLGLAGVAKLASGWLAPGHLGIVDWAWLVLAAAETVVGVALMLGRWISGGLLFATCIAAGGAIQAIGWQAPCRCFGGWFTIGWRVHVILCCSVGLLVALGSVNRKTFDRVSVTGG